jgi:hypothetical protein
MIAPDEIVRKAERRYRDVLRAWLDGSDLFPLVFPLGKPQLDLSVRRREIDRLRERSKETLGYGYTLEWDTINQRALGTQTFPRRAVISNRDDYLALIRRRAEFDRFTADATLIRRALPALADWIHANPQRVIEYQGRWGDLMAVCRCFLDNPRPGVYLRQLPVAVHTKFIETHTGILRDLLDVLLPPEAINTAASDFTARFGLRDKAPLVRVRLLDEQLEWEYDLRLDDLSLPVEQAARLFGEYVRPRRVLIVENLINFLTLPRLEQTVAVFGGGFGVHLLRDIGWLHQCDVLYWGDIDAHGFRILSDLRGMLPHTRSLMMDRATFDAYADYVVSVSATHTGQFDYLTALESELARHVTQHGLRLEQEHIPHVDALLALRAVLVAGGRE